VFGPLAAAGLAAITLAAASGQSSTEDATASPATLDQTRLTMGKWIETQQIISKERSEWQQGKELLLSRLELVKSEAVVLEEKTKAAQESVIESAKKRDALQAENDHLKDTGTQLATAVSAMEAEVRRLFVMLPKPLQEKIQPLYQRVPTDSAATTVSAAERFQNVLGILNEVNKAHTEISVSFEVHTLASGKPAEVRVMYLGLAQAYYVSATGEGGIGRPGSEGWTWEPSKAVAGDVLRSLEILQGKHSPAFVPLPVNIQ